MKNLFPLHKPPPQQQDPSSSLVLEVTLDDVIDWIGRLSIGGNITLPQPIDKL